jgi:hypothetical protein
MRAVDYSFDPAYAYIRLNRAPLDSVRVEYFSPTQLQHVVRRFAPLGAVPIASPSLPRATESPLRQTDERFEIAGSKKLSLGVGNDGGGLIEQSLSLSIRGEVGPNLKVEGSVTDRGTPAEAITRTASEFDKLSLRAYSPVFQAEFGDTELRRREFQLFSLDRRLSGLQAAASHRSIHGMGLLGQRRGEFRTRRFFGEEGKQGPYTLADANRVAVVPRSEKVWLDGQLLEYGADRDYEIDYPTGLLTFTERRPISRESRITVDYEIAAEAYSSLVYETGGGLAVNNWNVDMLVHREWDDPDRPKALSLLDSDRNVLAQAGDSAALAVRSGVDSVGAGQGDYDRDSTGAYFFVGRDSGSYDIVFSYVGPGNGDYRARGDGTFFFAGTDQGDHAPIIALALPSETKLYALRARRSWRAHTFDVEWAQSRRDLNRLSSFDDSDNRGDAWLGRYGFGDTASALGGGVYWQRRNERFRAPGRDAGVEYDRKWGDTLGATPSGQSEYGASFRGNGRLDRAQVAFDVLNPDLAASAWRTEGTLRTLRGGEWNSRIEILRGSQELEFEHGGIAWQPPLRRLPLALNLDAERRLETRGYRFGETGARFGPPSLNATVAYRRTDSLDTQWMKHSDLYRIATRWETQSDPLDASFQLNYERRQFTNYQTGSEDRLLSQARWVARLDDITMRLNYRLTRAQARSVQEEFVPVDPGRGDYRLENGQYVEDPLGDYVRIVRTASFGALARQSEKRANISWQPARTVLRAEVDLVTIETAADDDLPSVAWVLPWQVERESPARKHTLRTELSGGSAPMRWLWRNEWARRFDTTGSRFEDFLRVQTDLTMRVQWSNSLRLESRAGGGAEREKRLFPYDFTFARVGLTPAWNASRRAEISLPLSWQRYWLDGGTPLADWQTAGVRATVRVAERGRIVAEPSLVNVSAHQPALPLAVAEGRPIGTSGEWRLEGSLDLSGALVGRLLYRGRAQSDRPPVHRADISMEASF